MSIRRFYRMLVKDVEQVQSASHFKQKAKVYWNSVDANIDGMLGGLSELNPLDIRDSELFLKKLFTQHGVGNQRIAEMGAGIGRVSQQLFKKHFSQMVLVELIKKYCDRATVSFAKEGLMERTVIVNSPMEDFDPVDSFDIFWFQWCIGHLTDDEFLTLLNRFRSRLTPNGLIVIKDNFASTEKTEFDEDDSSVTRPYERVKELAESASFKIVEKVEQKDFPNGLFPVYAIALKPV